MVVKGETAVTDFVVKAEEVERMLEKAIAQYFSSPSAMVWKTLLTPEDIVGIKVYSASSGNSGTRVESVSAVVKSLVLAGIEPDRIIVWDRRLGDLRAGGFLALEQTLGVRVRAAADSGYSDDAFYETPLIGKLEWGDKEFGVEAEGVGRKSHVAKLVSDQMTKIISIAPAMNHNMTGTAGNLVSLALGSVDNTARFRAEARRLATAVPEIYAMEQISDRVVLCITDALICQFEGEKRGLLHYSVPLGEIRVSQDPVALDVLVIDDIQRLRKQSQNGELSTNQELYRNASLLQLGTSNPRAILVERFSIISS